MKARVQWKEKRNFKGTSGSGHGVVMSASAAEESLGPSPMEMVLLGLGGCSAYDVVNILEKMRQEITDCVVEMEAERAGSAPRVFVRIHSRFRVTGRSLDPRKVERAVELSTQKYCSASAMLARTAAMTREIEIREAGP